MVALRKLQYQWKGRLQSSVNAIQRKVWTSIGRHKGILTWRQRLRHWSPVQAALWLLLRLTAFYRLYKFLAFLAPCLLLGHFIVVMVTSKHSSKIQLSEKQYSMFVWDFKHTPQARKFTFYSNLSIHRPPSMCLWQKQGCVSYWRVWEGTTRGVSGFYHQDIIGVIFLGCSRKSVSQTGFAFW